MSTVVAVVPGPARGEGVFCVHEGLTPRARTAAARPPVGPGASWSSVLDGVREGVVVCDADGVVRTLNRAATDLLPRLAVGQPIETAGCADLAAAVRDGATALDTVVDGRVFTGRAEALGDGDAGGDDAVCWYLLDVTDERRDAASLRAAQDRARFLAEAGRSLHGVLNLDRTLRTAASLAVSRLAPTALVLLSDGSDTVRWACATAGVRRPATGGIPITGLRGSPRLLDALVGTTTPDPWVAIELADLDVWPGDLDAAAHRLVAVAVPTGGTVAAVLVLALDPAAPADVAADPDDPDGTQHDALVAEYVARVGTALSASALYREQSYLGTVLQESLAPPPLPAVDGLRLGAAYRPARESLRVGGDFYEVLHSDDGPADAPRTAFLLGDVCGKGIEAAVLSGRVRQSLHALRLVERRPGVLLDLLNTALLDAAAAYGETPRFATMVLGDARPCPDGSVVLRLATGGHPPPLVLRCDGRVEEVPVSGTLVGALRGGRFCEVEVVLAPGETCLLYSDGVVEARGGAHGAEFYGEERLEAAWAGCAGTPAPVACERLVQLLTEWLDGRDHDDVALLAIQAPEAR
jgi:serine phosphatase RsbU (regulator of sigma subunit)